VSLALQLEDGVRFAKRWAADHRSVGAIVPSSRGLARLMVEEARPDPEGYTLELGPGTGVMTQTLVDAGVPPERIVVVEESCEFCLLLEGRFPGIRVVRGDAFDLDSALAPFEGLRFSAALSGIPLLSFTEARRVRFVEGVLGRLVPGGRLAQFSYGLANPVPTRPEGVEVSRSRWVLRNLPPARVWTYAQAAAAGQPPGQAPTPASAQAQR